MKSFTGRQLGVLAVSVKFTDPARMSLAPGVYVGVNALLLEKVPSPAVVHRVVAAPTEEPCNVWNPGLLAHKLRFGPASTVGASVKLTVKLSDTGVQPARLAVMVRVTELPVRSAAEGEYMLDKELEGAKIPEPVLDQLNNTEPTELANRFTNGLFLQTLWFGPASIVGAAKTNT